MTEDFLTVSVDRAAGRGDLFRATLSLVDESLVAA
jgi:hypothetical protein